MRLTYAVATAAEKGLFNLPTLPHPAEWYTNAEQRLDEAKARADLSALRGVTWADGDGRAEMTMAVIFLDAVKETVDRLLDGDNGVSRVGRGEDTSKTLAGRRMKKGKVAYVRVEFKMMADGAVRCRLTAANPKGAIGNSENSARSFALVFADILLATADEMRAATGTVFALEDGGLAAGVFADARARAEAKARRETARGCEWRRGPYCACPPPCRCANYREGRCQPPKAEGEG